MIEKSRKKNRYISLNRIDEKVEETNERPGNERKMRRRRN
jgi:hypothetical protein